LLLARVRDSGRGRTSTQTTVTEHPPGVFTTVVHAGLSLGYVMPNGPDALGVPLTFDGVSLEGATARG
jgi:hypothetical protein